MTDSIPSNLSRRAMLQTASCGFGYLALAGLCNPSGGATVTARSLARPSRSARWPPSNRRFRRGRSRHHALHARGSVSPGRLRLQTVAGKIPRQVDAGRPVPRRCQGKEQQPDSHEVAVRVHAARQKRAADIERVPQSRQACRRSVPDQQHAPQDADPSAGRPDDAHGALPVHPPEHRLVGHLRPGCRDDRPARLCGHEPLREAMQCYNSAFLPAAYGATPINVSGEASKSIRNVANPG